MEAPGGRGGRIVAGSAWAALIRPRTQTRLHTIPINLGFVNKKMRLGSGVIYCGTAILAVTVHGRDPDESGQAARATPDGTTTVRLPTFDPSV
jgi:hypothetical protein